MAQGIDPNLEKRERVEASLLKIAEERKKSDADLNTFEAVSKKWLALEQHAWSDSHTKKQKGRLNKHVYPYLGNKPVSQITKLDTIAVIENIV
ncbi:MAG: hypothetical protein Q9N02_09435, partial [Ghiorsea sp.]|nr:hypothetical protein [Ghiorsea sp.]